MTTNILSDREQLKELVAPILDEDSVSKLLMSVSSISLQDPDIANPLLIEATSRGAIQCVVAVLERTQEISAGAIFAVSKIIGTSGSEEMANAIHGLGIQLSDEAFRMACLKQRESMALHLCRLGYPAECVAPNIIPTFDIFREMFDRSMFDFRNRKAIEEFMRTADPKIVRWTAVWLAKAKQVVPGLYDALAGLKDSDDMDERRLHMALCAQQAPYREADPLLSAALAGAAPADDPAVNFLVQCAESDDWAAKLLQAGLPASYTSRGRTLTDIAWSRQDYYASRLYHDAGSPFSSASRRMDKGMHGLDFVEMIVDGTATTQPRLWTLSTKPDRVRALVEVYPHLLNERALGGITPLMATAKVAGEVNDVMQILLDLGAAVNTNDCRGDTALHHACRRFFKMPTFKAFETIEMLLAAGASAAPINRGGFRPQETPVAMVGGLGADLIEKAKRLLDSSLRRENLSRALGSNPAGSFRATSRATDVI